MKINRFGLFMNNPMNIDDILASFNDVSSGFPTEAVESAIAQREQITPRLLALLEYTILNYKKVTEDQMDYIFAIYILSKFKEAKAFPLIVKLASLPDEWSVEIFGDCLIEALPRFLISTFHDELFLLKNLIENTSVNEWSRSAALKSLLGLVVSDKMERDELISYFRSLFNSILIDEPVFTANLIEAATDLYPDELFLEIDLAYENDKVDTSIIDIEMVIDVLDAGKEESIENNLYHNVYLSPIDNIEEDMSWMEVFDSEDESQLDEGDEDDSDGHDHQHCHSCDTHSH